MKLTFEGSLANSSCNVVTGPLETKIHHQVEIYDNTLREGEQPPGVVFTSDEKFEIAQMLDEIGVHWASVGFPAVSEEERQIVLRLVKAGLKFKKGALCRMLPRDIDITVDCGVDQVGLFIGGSDSHLQKLKMTEADALKKIEESVRQVKQHPRVQCWFAIEDVTRTPLRRLVAMYQLAIDHGCDCLVLADTVGTLTPMSTFRFVSLLKGLFPKTMMTTHFHNDLGLAHANTLMAMEAGAENLQVTVNGAGERAGNACLEEVVMSLQLKYGLPLGIKTELLGKLCEFVHRASGTRPAEHKPVTGKWCFTHESGIHVAGVLANAETYQPYPPQMVGRHHEVVFGKHSGVQSLNYLAEKAGVRVSDSARKAVLEKLKKQAERKEGTVSVDQVLEWLRQET